MEFARTIDVGGVPEYFVDGLARWDLISPESLRLSFYATHHVDDEPENRMVLHVRWDRNVWLATTDIIMVARPQIMFPSRANGANGQALAFLRH